MNYWIITDTHLGHDKLVKEGYRPGGFEAKIFYNLKHCLKPDDILIHLGDVCLGGDDYWNTLLMRVVDSKTWLTLGNHDNKSYGWYLSHGWNMVGESLMLDLFGKRIAFSHVPITKHDDFDINIHGHLHDTNHRNIEGLTDKHKLLFIEHTYTPVNLRKFIGA